MFLWFSRSIPVVIHRQLTFLQNTLELGILLLGAPVRLNMSISDITQACISISITLDIGWWVIRCRHYCTTSSLLGETQLSRLEHTAIVSTICYECHTQANQQTNHYISNIQPTIRFRFADTLSCLDHVLEYCLGIHV